MNKNGRSTMEIIMIIIMILTMFGAGLSMYKSYKIRSNDCLKEKAINYCNEQGMNFEGEIIPSWKKTKFVCETMDGRKLEENRFNTQELEECLE